MKLLDSGFWVLVRTILIQTLAYEDIARVKQTNKQTNNNNKEEEEEDYFFSLPPRSIIETYDQPPKYEWIITKGV